MERTADAMLGVVVEEDMPLDKVSKRAPPRGAYAPTRTRRIFSSSARSQIVVVCSVVGGQVDVKACVAALPDCEPLVLEHCIRTYSLPADGRQEDKDNGVPSEVGGAPPLRWGVIWRP